MSSKKNRSPQSRPRPPILAIVLLVALTVTVLTVVTLRQLKSAEARRLRLLAGFSDRIESTVEDYTGHVLDVLREIVPEGADETARFNDVKQKIDDRLGQLKPRYVEVQPLRPVDGDADGAGRGGPETAAEIRLGADGLLGYITYRGPVPAAVQRLPERKAATAASSETTDQGPLPEARQAETRPETPSTRVEVTVAVELRPTLNRIQLSNLFDSVIIAEPDGTVLVQQGEPELRTTTLLPLLETGTPSALRLNLLASDDEATDKTLLVLEDELPKALAGSDLGALRRRIDVTTQVVETEIAGAPYSVFLQPITVRLPRSEEQPVPQKLEWVACGVVSAERSLSTSFTTSPLLLALLFAVFPLGLILWPFLKLWLTSPRQPFSRFDVASLIFSSLLGLSLLVLVLLDLSFLFQLRRIEDEQLVALSRTVRTAFLHELHDAYHTLRATDELLPEPDPKAEESEPLATGWESWRKMIAELRGFEAGAAAAGDSGASAPDPGGELAAYPYFHAIFRIDEHGDQRQKIALRDSARPLNRVEDRGYFRCARDRQMVTLEVPPGGPASAAGGAADAAGGRRGNPAAGAEGDHPHRFEVCLDSVLSKTSREALAVLSIARNSPEIPAAALTTQLLSFHRPLLPDGFGYAVLEHEGRVLFHSDPQRNLIENFLKAADEDSLLESLMASRRAGLLSLTYWGRAHRAFAQPLDGVPWTLVVFRDVQEPRLRNLEAVVGFLNPFMLCFVGVTLLAALLLAMLPGRYLSMLWPHRRALPAYELIVWTAIGLLTAFAAVLASGSPAWTFAAAVVLPVLALVVTVGLLWAASRPFSRLSGAAGWRRVLRGPLVAVTLVAVASALYRSLERAEAGDAWSPWWPMITLLAWFGLSLASLLPDRWLPRPLRRLVAAAGRWLIPLLLVATLGLVTPWLRSSPAVPLLTLAVAATCAALVRWRHQFEGSKRRFAYLFTLTALIATLALVPTVGFFEIARERQLEFLVQDHQAGLARSLEKRVETFRELAEQSGDTTGLRHATYGKRPGAALQVFFDTAYHPAADCETSGPCQPVSRASWAEAGRRAKAAGNDGPGGEISWSLTRIARLYSARPVAVTDLATGPMGVDLSRFDATQVHTARAGSRLTAEVRSAHGTGTAWHLTSRLPPRAATGVVDEAGGGEPPYGAPRLALLGLLCLGVLATPVGLGYLISHQALLITLVRPGLGADDQEEARRRSAVRQRAPASLSLLLQRVMPQTRKELQLQGERPQAGTFDHLLHGLLANRGRPLRILFVSSIPDLMLERARPYRGIAVIESGELEARARRLLFAAKTGDSTPVVVAVFRPELRDSEIGHRRLTLLRRLVEEHDHSLVLVAMAEPSRLLGDHLAEDAVQRSELHDRWSSFLATFALRYGRDEAEVDPVLMPRILERVVKVLERTTRLRPRADAFLLTGDEGDETDPASVDATAPTTAEGATATAVDRADQVALRRLRQVLRTDPALLVADPGALTPEARHYLGLLSLLYRECCGTRHMQHLGRRLLDELPDPERSDSPLTRQSLLSRIGYLARPYYRAIWTACDTDEKVTLYQMAEGGMANPKAYDRVLDLMERGLVIRDPALRLMNDSFARYVRTAVRRSQVLEWEGEAGTSAWSVLKWLLPLPLLLLGGFLFLTQRDSFSNLVGFVVALGSIAPILANLYQYFEQVTARRAEAASDEAAAKAAGEA